MAVKEITTFSIGPYEVQVTGSECLLLHKTGIDGVSSVLASLTRTDARDLSKALSHAADIVRTKRKPKAKP